MLNSLSISFLLSEINHEFITNSVNSVKFLLCSNFYFDWDLGITYEIFLYIMRSKIYSLCLINLTIDGRI
jgi:hypothetical protein